MNLLAVVVADYVGLILMVAMLISSRIRRSDTLTEYKIFSVIGILSAVACVVDFLTFFSDGKSGILFLAINVIGNTYCFVANPIFAIGWCMYTELKLYKSESRIKRRYKYLAIPGVILVVICVINLFVPLVFTIDENNVYSRMPLSYFYYIVATAYMIYSVFVVKTYEKRFGKVRFFPLSLMLGPIAIGCLLQNLFYGVSLIWVSIAVGMTSIYMSIQNEFSYQDKLTGLYNRAYMYYVFNTLAKDPNSRLGGIMIDLDFFKKINDTFGHSVGDAALVDVGTVLTTAKPDRSIAVRFAGDEFILLVKDASEEVLKRTIQDVKDELVRFNKEEGRQYELSLSMGYTLYDRRSDDMDSFLRHMDEKMYEEKEHTHTMRE
ncbi:MAG: GGDEF domain-containing protein [Butyrivibrio sp.]|nr:GGDEF domain-containing protein [Butyrivibrio sp.]